MSLTKFELGELYRDVLISLSYMFAYEYGERADDLRDSGRWDTWVQGVQENYGPTINRVLDALVVPGTEMETRVETWYRENYLLTLQNTLASLTRQAFESIYDEVGWRGRIPQFARLHYLNLDMLTWIEPATGLRAGREPTTEPAMWSEWGLEIR